MQTELSQEDIKAFEPAAKVGLLATVNEEGHPHISLITSIMAKSPTQLMWGQFTEGLSKKQVKTHPQTGFLVMSIDRNVWRGQADWTHCVQEGDDFIYYNQLPMFRYNSYFGIHTVHYMNLKSVEGKKPLFMPAIIAGSVASIARSKAKEVMHFKDSSKEKALKPWAANLMSKPDTLKFLAYIKKDGYPSIIPVVPASPVHGRSIIIAPTVYTKEILSIPSGAKVALLALNLTMESVLVRGTLTPSLKVLHGGFLSLKIDWAYNGMPPIPGQIYPEIPLRPVTEF